ncbi:uncharacterized protein LOC130901111 [Diorhabda carinulata]|uniref:uncharacterized protein LOC130901111 n=1 Tax=Diorhabda carinulata TaxID=1163345 RepID=UPI0025A15FFA|nr:uncharacterized protein LOC130901111 [Diorhabda carinulata]
MSQDKEAQCLTKTNLLAYQKPEGEKTEQRPCQKRKQPAYSATISRCQPKVIKICTGAEMKKMCPPPCDCTIKPRSSGRSSGALGILFLGIKAAIAATLVYVSYDMGIWGTTDDTQDLYRKYCAATSQPKKRNDKWDPPSCEAQKELFAARPFNPYGHCDEAPINPERSFHTFQNKWNKGVECVFGSLACFPNNIINLFCGDNKQKNQLTRDKQDTQPRCIPYNQLPDEQKVINSYK